MQSVFITEAADDFTTELQRILSHNENLSKGLPLNPSTHGIKLPYVPLPATACCAHLKSCAWRAGEAQEHCEGSAGGRGRKLMPVEVLFVLVQQYIGHNTNSFFL